MDMYGFVINVVSLVLCGVAGFVGGALSCRRLQEFTERTALMSLERDAAIVQALENHNQRISLLEPPLSGQSSTVH